MERLDVGSTMHISAVIGSVATLQTPFSSRVTNRKFSHCILHVCTTALAWQNCDSKALLIAGFFFFFFLSEKTGEVNIFWGFCFPSPTLVVSKIIPVIYIAVNAFQRALLETTSVHVV